MLFLWVTSKKPGAELIRWGCSSDCSHFAVVFDESPRGYGVVIHAELLGGVHIEWWGDFKEKHRIVHALKVKDPGLTLSDEETIYQNLIHAYYGQGYDYRAFFYWALKIIENKLLGSQIPPRNAWADDHKELCTELGKGLSMLPFLQIPQLEDYAMVMPHSMYLTFKRSPMLEEIVGL